MPRKDPLVSRAYWERRAAEKYDSDFAAREDVSYTGAVGELVGELGGLDWSSLIEMGCGFGRVLGEIRRAFPERRLTGSDFSTNQLRHAQVFLAGADIGLLQSDARCLPFANRRFDIVLTAGMLIYLHPSELPGALREFRRVATRWIVLLEYAREHMDSELRRGLMAGTPSWYGHDLSEALLGVGIEVVKAFPTRSFASQAGRVPQSLILGKVIP